MTYTNTFNEGAALLEQERQKIWNDYQGCSEAQRIEVWHQRKAQLLSCLLDDSTPRAVGPDQGASSPSQAYGTAHQGLARQAIDIPGAKKRTHPKHANISAVPMSRSTTSKSTHLSNMSVSPSYQLYNSYNSTSKQSHQQSRPGHPGSSTYGTTGQSLGGTGHYQRPDDIVFDPREYIELSNSSDYSSQVTAKRQRVNSLAPSSVNSYQCQLTPSTSISSSLSPTPFTVESEAMSRQTSMTSQSFADAMSMMRMNSSLSTCSDRPLFTFDENEEQLCQSFVSNVTEVPSSSDITRYTDYGVFDSDGQVNVGSQQLFFNDVFPSNAEMTLGQGYTQDMAVSASGGAEMKRSDSEQSNASASSMSSADIKAKERLEKHIQNGKRQILIRQSAVGPTSADHRCHDKARPLRPQEQGVKKQLITKQVYTRPAHPKLLCPICNERPDGFRGEHELKRHHDRKHANTKKVWICVDPHIDTAEGWRPTRPLEICKQCIQQKQYNVYYNAAAHLRRAHFFPRKRGRKARGEEREKRAGKAGGDFPAINWLKAAGFLKEVEVSAASASVGESNADEDEEYDHFEEESDPQMRQLTSEELELPSYPFTTDFSGYMATELDMGDMQWSTTGPLQASMMGQTMSAPPVMMTMNDYGNMHASNNFGFAFDSGFGQ